MKTAKKQKNQKTLKKSYKRFYEKCIIKAKKMIPNKNKISKKIKKARKIFERLRNIPKCKKLSTDICNFCDLLSDYFDGVYTNLPLSTIVAVVGGILYVVLPFDVIGDFLPLLGWTDDAAVLSFIIMAEQNDVNEYLEWKKDKNDNMDNS